jgi:SAM-dependent methyltransferase
MSITPESPPEFDEYAKSYSELLDDPLRNRFTQDPLHFHKRKWILLEKYLLSEGRNPGEMRWLDVGCGKGDLLALAGRRFAYATGCDRSIGMLPSDSPFEMRRQSSPTAIPSASGSFDLVTVVCVYHHVHGLDRDLLAKEILRVLKPGGICCVIEHNPFNPITRSIVKRCPVDVDAELISAPAARDLFRANGFEIAGTEYFLYFPERYYSRFGRAESYLRSIPFGGQYSLVMKAPSE